MSAVRTFGRYRVTGTLGVGAMGEVFAAVDEVLGRQVAVKTLKGNHTGLAARMLDERFRLEARAVAALNHPGIVQVYDIDLAAEPPYLVMERMVGPSLKEQFDHGPLAANEIRALGIQIARALAAAHMAGIIHRDVKPANILIAGAGAWKLADFGVAHVPDSSLTMTGQFIGSPAYAPPEALLRGQSTSAGDVFGLGATLYYGAAGRWPRADATTGGLLAPVPSVRDLAPDLPEDLIAAIDRAVMIEPDLRPTASELADELAGGAPRRDDTRGAPLRPTPDPTATAVLPDDARPFARAPAAATPHDARPFARAPTPLPIETAFVPDATTGSPPRAPTPVPIQTAFVPDATTASPSRPLRWKPWAIGAGALVALIIVVAAATRKPSPAGTGSGSASLLGTPAADTAPLADEPPVDAPVEEPELELPPPGQIRTVPPPITASNRDAAEDWNDLVDDLYRQKFDKASKKLREFDRSWGESRETRSLRKQLERIPGRRDTD